MPRRPLLALVALLAGLSAFAATAVTAAPVPAATTKACGWRHGPPRTYDHVVWVVLENHSYEDLVGARGSSTARRSPYLNRLAAACGVATNAHAVTHPSLPNYLAMVSGSTGGVTSDCLPASCPQHRRTLFDQLRARHRSWRVLAEAMPTACRRTDAGRYAPKHNAATYFPALAKACARFDLPMGTTSRGRLVSMVRGGHLPSFLLVVPDQCHNTHDCPVGEGDAWLSTVLPLILSGRDYRAGRTAVFVTWDEGAGGSHGQICSRSSDRSCHIATLVVAPAVRPGTRSSTGFDHYSLLKTTELMLGIPALLGHAGDRSTAGMRRPFRI